MSDTHIVSCSHDRHAAAILDIFNDAIVTSTALYDYQPRPLAGMAAWFDTKARGNFPVIGIEDGAGTLLAFGSFGTFRAFPAYKYTVEHSVYVHKDHRGRGLGAQVMQALIAAARAPAACADRRHRRHQRRQHRAAPAPGLHPRRHAAAGGLQVRPLAGPGVLAADAGHAGRACRWLSAGPEPQAVDDTMRSGTATDWACVHWAWFDTAFGRCALAWDTRGLTGVRLPGRDDATTARGWPADRVAQVLPPFATAAVQAMQAHLAGQAHDLRDVPLAMDAVAPFERQVYDAARALDPGRTCTYGELARRIGQPSAARAVGAALGANPWPIVIPCHRVLAAGGGLGGFSAPGGTDTKRALLLLERTMLRREDELF